jgi:hypothetical protein
MEDEQGESTALTTHYPHLSLTDIEEVSRTVGMAHSICPRADFRTGSFWWNHVRDVCASARLQCSGDAWYEAGAARNRARIAADRWAENLMLETLNRPCNYQNRAAA